MKFLLLALTIIAMSFAPAYGQSPHTSQQTRSDQLYLAVFKKIVEDWQESHRKDPKCTPPISFYCLSLDKSVDKDGSRYRRLVASLQKAKYRILPRSACDRLIPQDKPPYGAMYHLVDKEKKQYGLHVSITSVRWSPNTKAVVRAGYYAGARNAMTGDHVFVLKKQGWVFLTLKNAVVA